MFSWICFAAGYCFKQVLRLDETRFRGSGGILNRKNSSAPNEESRFE